MKKKKISLTPEQKKEVPIKEVPLKEDVDIEFEYKVYMLFDKLKKYKIFIISGFVTFILVIAAAVYIKSEKEKVLNEASAIAYDIGKMFSENKEEEAKKLIEKLKNQYGDTPYVKIAVAYEILLEKEKRNPDKNKITELKNLLETDQLKSGLNEYYGYVLHLENKDNEALQTLDQIDQKYYNYISGLLLKGFIYRKQGKDAGNIFKQVMELSKYNYFRKIAEENL
ncbi:tetratricopeptide repeat protein [Persephonella sp.]